jgi:aminoglycoside phosphotransferase (APT) family kinase protein
MSPLLDESLRALALAHVPGCEAGAEPLEMSPLAGGTANSTYRVRTRDGEFALRLHDPGSTLLGIDRGSELLLHQAAARAGIAPALIAADPAGRFLISEYRGGAVWRPQDMGDPVRLQRLAQRLRALHALPAPPAPDYDPSRLLDAHAERIARADAAAGSQLTPWLKRAQRILRDCALARRPHSIIHNDLHHSNILDTGAELYLIDWEYAAVADPLFDLACLIAYYPDAGAHAPMLIDVSGLPGVELALLQQAAWVYTLLSYLWYRVLALTSAPNPADAAQERELRRRLVAS